jgi:hypothetical protein
MSWAVEPEIKVTSHAITRATSARMAVAKLLETPESPLLPNTETNAAKIALEKANASHMLKTYP